MARRTERVSFQTKITDFPFPPILCSGYMAPEYAMHGLVSPKVDIFSFGVLVLEIVTRRSNCGSDDYSAVNLLSDVSAGRCGFVQSASPFQRRINLVLDDPLLSGLGSLD